MGASNNELKLSDVYTYLRICRSGTLSAAARDLRVTVSQVSKAVTRVEASVGGPLLTRSSRGVVLTERGARVVGELEEIVARLERLHEGATESDRSITIAAPSYLSSAFLVPITEALPELRLRAIELAVSSIVSLAPTNLFDVAFISGERAFPPSWTGVPVGIMRSALFGSPRTAARLAPHPVSPDLLRNHPIISPLDHQSGKLVGISDQCPLGVRRSRGHEVSRIGTALDLAVVTDQIVFGPTLAAYAHLARGTLVEIPVRGWDVHEQLLLWTNADRVKAQHQRALVDCVRKTLETANGAQGPFRNGKARSRKR